MANRMTLRTFLALTLALASGCAASSDEKVAGPEDDAPLDGKLDSFRRPTDHGGIAFGELVRATVTRDQGFHTWTFALTGPATLTIATSRVPHERTLDTVVYLYRLQDSGTFGRYIERNDDYGDSLLSRIEKSFDAGTYRVLVKGYSVFDLGPFALKVDCAGTGCAAPVTRTPPARCLFGATLGSLLSSTAYRITDERALTVADAPSLSDARKAQIVEALHASTHTDVMTIEAAFAAADSGEIIQRRIYDERGARSFVVFEYGAGDNPYGRVFEGDSPSPVADIHDTDIEHCTAFATRCVVGSRYRDMWHLPDLAIDSERTVTSADGLTAVEEAQVLAGVRHAYSDAATLEDAFAAVDSGEINIVLAHETRGGTGTFTAVEYGAGDNSYGMIFARDSEEPVAEISDGDLYACSVQAPRWDLSGYYYPHGDTMPPGTLTFLELRNDDAFQSSTSAGNGSGTYALYDGVEGGTLELTDDSGEVTSYDFTFDGRELRVKAGGAADWTSLIATGTEEMCDSTGGSYLDDDPTPEGDYCVCTAPAEWVPGAGGCVEL